MRFLYVSQYAIEWTPTLVLLNEEDALFLRRVDDAVQALAPKFRVRFELYRYSSKNPCRCSIATESNVPDGKTNFSQAKEGRSRSRSRTKC